MGEMADDFLDDVLDYMDWLETAPQEEINEEES